MCCDHHISRKKSAGCRSSPKFGNPTGFATTIAFQLIRSAFRLVGDIIPLRFPVRGCQLRTLHYLVLSRMGVLGEESVDGRSVPNLETF